MKRFKQTKIICTIGPASESYDVMKSLVEAGMDVMRMNFSHGDHESHKQRLDTLDKINKELNEHVAALLDTKGPEIRTHLFKDGKALVHEGDTVEVHMNEIEGDGNKFSVNYPKLYKDIKVGNTILVDDGYLELTVTNIDHTKQIIYTKAENTHTLKNRKGIKCPWCQTTFGFYFSKRL